MRVKHWLLMLLGVVAVTAFAGGPTPTTAVPAPTVTATAVITTPAPAQAGRWECYQGGLACSDFLFAISMLNAEAGWAVGDNGVVLRYTTWPGQTQPTWQQVQVALFLKQPLWGIKVAGPDEWWAADEAGIVHYKAGQIEEYKAGRLLDVAIAGPDEAWAVGRDGLIVHYKNGQVEKVDSPTKFPLSAIEMVSPDEGWAVGEEGLFHYHNQIWERMPMPEGVDFQDFNFGGLSIVNGNEVWAVGKSIVRYKGGEWDVMMAKVEEGDSLLAISMVSSDEGWAVGDKGRIMHYQAGQWQEVASPTKKRLMGVAMTSPEEGWAVGLESTVLHYHQGVWELVSESAKPLIQGVSDIDWMDGEGWIVGGSGIYHYRNEAWQRVASPIDDPKLDIGLYAIDMVSPAEGWAVGGGKADIILHYNQGEWQSVPSPVKPEPYIRQYLYDVAMINEQDGWAVGDKGVMLHYTQGNWQPIEPVTRQTLKAIDMVSESKGWAVGEGGTILHYQNGVWSKTELAGYKKFTQVDMIDETTGWILGERINGQAVVLHLVNNAWQPFDYPPGYLLSTLKMTSAEEGWFVSGNGMLHYQNGEWQALLNPSRSSIYALVMINENEGWAVGFNGILHYTNK